MAVYKTPNVHVGNRLKEWLKENKITAVFLSKQLGIPQSNFVKTLKRDSMKSDLLTNISNILQTNFFRLFWGDGGKDELFRKLRVHHVGNTIKYYMIQAGMTQNNMAEKLGVNQSHISNILRREVCETKRIEQMSDILGVNIFDDLSADVVLKTNSNEPDMNDLETIVEIQKKRIDVLEVSLETALSRLRKRNKKD